MSIHSTAIIDRRAELDPSVEVGAYAIVEAGVRIGAGTRLHPHSYIAAGTTIGQRCQVFPFAVIGHLPQDIKHKGERSYTQIGDDNLIREHVTIHRGTEPESTTRVGNGSFLMAASHVGHNCQVGHGVIMANGALLAGVVSVGDNAFISGNAVVHQFCRVGERVMVGGCLRVTEDVPPFMLVGPLGVVGPNVVGLRRGGLSAAERLEIRRCYRIMYRSGVSVRQAIDRVAAEVQTEPGRRLAAFLQARTLRGYARYLGRRSRVDDEATAE
jgi:UDP-N-acetylglucosamine acyltransferase